MVSVVGESFAVREGEQLGAGVLQVLIRAGM